MTVTIDEIDMSETPEERARREAREAMEQLAAMPQAFVAPPMSGQAAAIPDEPPPPSPNITPQMQGRMRAENARDMRTVLAMPQARAMGDQYRAGQMPTAAPRIVNDAQGREQQRIYPPGVLPPPEHESEASFNERFPPMPPAAPMREANAVQMTQPVPPPAAPPVAPSVVAPPPAGGAAPSLPPPGDARTISRARELDAPATASPGLPAFVGGASGARPTLEQMRPMLEDRLAGKTLPVMGGPKPPGNTPRSMAGEYISDALRRPLHGIGAALAAAAGRQTTPFRSDVAGARERERETVAGKQDAAELAGRRASAADERAQEDRELSLRERAQTALEEDRSTRNQRLEAQAEALDRYRTRQTEIQDAVADGRINEAQARTAQQQALTQLMRDRNDPNSAVSERARSAVGQQLAIREDATGRPLPVNVEGLAAADLPPVSQSITGTRAVARPSAAQRQAAGASRAETTEALEGRARAVDMTQQQIDSYGSDRRGRDQLRREVERLERERRGAADEGDGEGVEIWTGVRGGSFVTPPEARGFREGLATAGTANDSISVLEGIYRRRSLEALVDPGVESEIAPHIMTLRGLATEFQHTGTINEGEAPTINAALPDVTSFRGRTLRDVERSVNAWRQRLESGVIRRARSLGVSDEAALARIRAELRRGGAGAQQERPAARPDVVSFTYGGRTRSVPAAQAEEARRRLRAANVEFTEGGR